MNIKLGLATGLTILLLSGCSVDDVIEKVEEAIDKIEETVEDTKSITEQISERHAVAIAKHYTRDECIIKVNEAEEMGLVNVIFSMEDNDITCEDYGKKNDDIECAIKDTGADIDTSCVIGGDAPGTPSRDSVDMELDLHDEASIVAIELI